VSSEDDGGYVHDPGAFDESGERVDDDGDGEGSLESVERAPPTDGDREFDWRGWVLIGVLVVALFVAPGLIIWNPPGLPYRAALLALPMVPALLLGLVAVWATTRP
jgi:hypothetical protein